MIDERWKTRLLSTVLCAAALLTALWGYALALRSESPPIRVLGERSDPTETTAFFFNALCLREWDEAASFVLGSPELGLNEEPAGALEREIWLAYQQSWSWSLGEGGRTDPVNAWQEVSFSVLRPDLLSKGLREDVQSILARMVDETDDLSSVYAEDGQFRPEAVSLALDEAVRARLASPGEYTGATRVTLRLRYRDGRWQILPEEALWEALSGGGGGE